MRAFAELLDRLVLTPQRNGKLRLLVDYFRATPDPDRGLALAAITRDLELQSVKPAMLRALITERTDPTLFAYSYDYVGDLAETISLIWPGPSETAPGANLPLGIVVHELQNASRREGPMLVAGWLDLLGISERYALLKLVTGGLRVGVSARLAKQALADFGNVNVVEIEELWHGQSPPYEALFAWLEGRGEKPAATAAAPFRPVMLATALDEAEIPCSMHLPTVQSGNGTVFGCRPSRKTACAVSIHAPVTIFPAHSRIFLKLWISKVQSTANYSSVITAKPA